MPRLLLVLRLLALPSVPFLVVLSFLSEYRNGGSEKQSQYSYVYNPIWGHMCFLHEYKSQYAFRYMPAGSKRHNTYIRRLALPVRSFRLISLS
jgi:hypothetical protein